MGELNENLSLTELVNSALVGIGDAPIEDLFDDNNGKAKLCRMLVMQCIREVQSHQSGCWDELVDFERLTPTADYMNENVKSYNLPLNCLCVRFVKDENNMSVPYKMFGRTIKTPFRVDRICFVRFSDNPEEWSAELKSCVIALLSAKMLAAIAKNYKASREAVEAFWALEFPRWAGSRMNKSESAIPGHDAELSAIWGESPHTALNNPDWF